MKQQVINYEFEILQNQLIRKNQSRSLPLPDAFRYTPWKLNDTLKIILPQRNNYELKWIGNSPDSYIVSYFYCVMKTCSGNPQLMIKLKHSLYKVCQYCLNLSQQRNLVQFLNILQDQGNIDVYLKNNRHAEDLLVKIYETSLNIAKIDTSNAEVQPFERLKLYTKRIFSFMTIITPITNEDVLQIKLEENQPVFIIRQKDCYFVLDNNTIPSYTKSPHIEECVIIDEEVEEDTILIQNDRISQKSKTDSQATSKEKIKNKVPKFLNNSQNMKEKHKKQGSNPTKVQNKNRIILPINHNYSNKIITNFQLKNKDKSEDHKQKNDKSNSRSNKNISPEIHHPHHKKSQVDPSLKTTLGSKKKTGYQPKNPSYNPKTKVKQTQEQDSILGKVSSFSKLPSSLGFQKFKSEEAIRVPEEHSTDLSKKKNANKSIVQKEKIQIYSPNKGSQEEVSQSNQQKNVIQNQQQNFRGKISPRFSNVTPYRTNYEYKPK